MIVISVNNLLLYTEIVFYLFVRDFIYSLSINFNTVDKGTTILFQTSLWISWAEKSPLYIYKLNILFKKTNLTWAAFLLEY